MDRDFTICRMDGPQPRWFHWMVVLSLVFHGVVLCMGSTVLVRPGSIPSDPVVMVELMEAPPLDPPASPPVLKADPGPPEAAARKADVPPVVRRQAAPTSARKWLDKLDDPLAPKTAASPRATAARPASGQPAARPDDFDLVRSRTARRDGGKGFDELERRVRSRGTSVVLGGEGNGAAPIFSGATNAAGDPIPPGVRDMIRNRVAGYLPELEAAYSAAVRVNPDIKGKMVLRIRIDARGNVSQVEPVETAVPDSSFAAAVLAKVRGWVFRPSAGFAVEVIYPFLFVAPT